MSISNVNDPVSNVNSTSASADTKLTKQYQEQYQQLLSQYETALSDWNNLSTETQTCIGESVSLAIDKQLTEAEQKLKELQAAIYALGEMVDTEAEEVKNKKMTEAVGALLAKLNVNLAAATVLAAGGANIDELRKLWEGVPDADKAYLGGMFIQTIDAQFSALNTKISELKQAIEEGAEPSVIEKLQAEISELTTQLTACVSGTADGSVMSVTDRIACLKSLEEAKQNGYITDAEYVTFKRQLLQTDLSKQISQADFEAQLSAIVQQSVGQKAREKVEEAESTSQSYATRNELFKNNIALKVMQAKNNFLEFEIAAKADKALYEKAHFTPQMQRLRDEGRWQTPEITRQREMTSEQINAERRREATTRVQ